MDLSVGENRVNPLGFDNPLPVFSWKLPPGTEAQTAYQVRVENKWDSGWVESDQTRHVPYGGEPLAAREKVIWRVRFRDELGRTSAFSQPAELEMGLLGSPDWQAEWIRPRTETALNEEPVGCLRREFDLPAKVEKARLYVTARGLFQVHLNGQKVGADTFTPGWVSYNRRLDTLTYDVTDLLKEGPNAVAALLAKGWYAGRLVWEDALGFFGKDPQLLLQLEVSLRNETRLKILSDNQWKANFKGPICSSSIYDGEVYDARREMPGWSESGFDDAAWEQVAADPNLGNVELLPKTFPTVRSTQRLAAVAVTAPRPGHFIFDLGQNMVGWAEIHIPVEEGKKVHLRFGEMLNADGSLYTDNYRSAKSADCYIPSRTGTIVWKPTFTFHGFRYVELSGFAENREPQLDWIQGVVLHSDLLRTGTFESSHEKLNHLQRNIVWSQRGNFLDIPTDCPQRDERLGWTADAQVFCPTALFNYDGLGFFKSWLRSMRDDQLPNGLIPNVIPSIPGIGEGSWMLNGSPGWVDAAVIIPWEVFVRTGDSSVLRENFEMMVRHVICWRNREQPISAFGDWLQPHSEDKIGDTSIDLLCRAFYAHSAQILLQAAEVLELPLKQFAAEAHATRQDFIQRFIDTEGRLVNVPETQTAYLVALAMDLVPDPLKFNTARHLAELVRSAEGHLRTGFLGTPFVLAILDRFGYTDMALDMLFKETYPSWFYPINQGATTMWERWNSYTLEDGFNADGMNSFNHYAYGAIGQWLYERIAGLAPDPDHPGYKHFFIQPLIPAQLTWARAELETPHGKASCAWQKTGPQVKLDVLVPPNTTASVYPPDGSPSREIRAGAHTFLTNLPPAKPFQPSPSSLS